MAKVLIVEDDEALRDVFGLIVQQAGHTVQAARNGLEGLEQMEAFEPDVVLLDMLMPVKSGLDVLQEAQIAKNYPQMTVIILSNLSDSAVINKALTLGAVTHLIKSNIVPQELIAAIEPYCP